MPCSTPGIPLVMAAPPAASTPTSRASVSTKPAKVPAAFDPPPTQADDDVGVGAAQQGTALHAGLLADDALELAHHVRERMGSHHRAEAVVGVSTVATHSRSASFTASLRVRLPEVTVRTSAPRSSMRNTFSSWRFGVDLAHEHRALEAEQRGRRGRGHAVLAGPGLGDHAASCPCAWSAAPGPTTLFSLCEPVWARSSRLRSTRTPRRSERRAHSVTGVGRPP